MAFSTASSESFFPQNTGYTDSHNVQTLLRFLSSTVFNHFWSGIWKLLFTHTHRQQEQGCRETQISLGCLFLSVDTTSHITKSKQGGQLQHEGGNERADG